MASDYLTHYEELHSAAMYDHDLTRNMLKSIMRAEENSEDFRFSLRDTLKQVESEISEIRYMSYFEKYDHMIKLKLDVKSILKLVKKEYRKLRNNGE